MAKDFARIHWQNLVNFGVLPLQFVDDADYDRIEAGSVMRFADLHASLEDGDQVEGDFEGGTIRFRHGLSERQREVLMRGGLIPWLRRRLDEADNGSDAVG